MEGGNRLALKWICELFGLAFLSLDHWVYFGWRVHKRGRDAKKGDLGEQIRANFSQPCANYWPERCSNDKFRHLRRFQAFFYANFSVAERTLLLIRTLFVCLKRKGPLKMFTKSESGADIEYIIIHLILFHPALLTLQKLKTKKYLKLMKKVWSLRFFSLICSIIKQLFNMGEGVVMLLEVKNACYSAKIANMLKNGFFLLFRIRRTFW